MAHDEPFGAAVKEQVGEEHNGEVSREDDEGQEVIVQHDAGADQRIEQEAGQPPEQAELQKFREGHRCQARREAGDIVGKAGQNKDDEEDRAELVFVEI